MLSRVLSMDPGVPAGKIRVMARQEELPLDPIARAAEKQRSRDEDARALASGEKSLEELSHENGAIARVLARGRIDLAASRSLG